MRLMLRTRGGDPDHQVHKLLDFTGHGGNVADPWYTGDFDATYRDVLAGCKAVLDNILKKEKV